MSSRHTSGGGGRTDRNAEVDGEAQNGRFADSLHVFPMTHHVECVAILEPVAKGS
jgi:hypothetical protein